MYIFVIYITLFLYTIDYSLIILKINGPWHYIAMKKIFLVKIVALNVFTQSRWRMVELLNKRSFNYIFWVKTGLMLLYNIIYRLKLLQLYTSKSSLCELSNLI